MHWKRTKDPSGNPKGFGFATYDDPDSVLCALRVLGGEKTDGVTLKAQDGSNVEKKMIVKADDNVRTHLEGHQRQQLQQDEAKTVASDDEKYNLVQQYIHAINAGQQPASSSAAASDSAETTAEASIDKELAFFKERAAERDDHHSQQHHQRQHHDGRRDSSDFPRRRGDGFVKGPTEYHSHQPPPQLQHQQDMATDEEIERRRQEKHERDVENAYHQREKRFETRENQKLREYKKDMKRELELEEREAKDKAYWLERLANWDDDVEMAKGEEPYYHDRSRWRRMRESQRRREEERDEEDRRREVQEAEDEHARLEEEERRRKDSRLLNREADDGKIALKPTKLNFNMPIKRNTLGGADEDEEEEAKKKRRVLVPLDYGDIDQVKTDYEDEEPMSSEERQRRVKQLIDSIPSSQEDLWKYTVKWDELNEVICGYHCTGWIAFNKLNILGLDWDKTPPIRIQENRWSTRHGRGWLGQVCLAIYPRKKGPWWACKWIRRRSRWRCFGVCDEIVESSHFRDWKKIQEIVNYRYTAYIPKKIVVICQTINSVISIWSSFIPIVYGRQNNTADKVFR